MHVKYEKISLNEQSLFLFKEFIQPRFTSPYHYHDEYELIHIKRGQGKLLAGNQVLNFSEGETYLFAPGLSHAFFNNPENNDLKRNAHAVVIQFKQNFLGEEFWNKMETTSISKMLNKSIQGILFLDLGPKIIDSITKLGNVSGVPRLSSLLLIMEDLSNRRKIKVLSAADNNIVTGKADSKVIADVFKYVVENFRKDISFSKAAEVAHMQKAAFCRFFKRKTNKKYSAFVNEIRIAHARKLLSESDMSIIEICYECGFSSLSYFNRQFKILTGSSPREFRGLLE